MTDLLVSGTGAGPAQVRRASGSGSWALVADLAGVQAVRILRHPVFLLGLGWFVVLAGIDGRPDTPYAQYSTVTGTVAFLMGPIAFFAANLVASSGRRSGADEWTPSLPMPRLHRTTALLLACLAPAASPSCSISRSCT